MRRIGILLLLVISLTLVFTGMAFAQEPPNEAPPPPLPDTGLDNAEGKSGRILPSQDTGMDQAEGASGRILPMGRDNPGPP